MMIMPARRSLVCVTIHRPFLFFMTSLSDFRPHALADRLSRNRLSRRDALWLFGAATASLQGCAVSPVTGERILVGMSEGQEQAIDQQQAPHQFSQDLGEIQNAPVNDYVRDIGQRLHAGTHRPDMPYSYRVLNANYVNAYTFPGGAMGVTRGIMVDMDDEAQLAALLGHELGHVNARHSAQRQGQAMLTQTVLAGVNAAAANSGWAPLIGLGSQVGASAMLSSYSRSNEHEADALGQAYMVQAGYPATGMTRLHEMLVAQEGTAPSALATMFSSHPMSADRRDRAREAAETTYADSIKASVRRERFMDSTASLRQIKPAIQACQKGESAMSAKKLDEASSQFRAALKQAPRDYAANLRMAQCLQAQGKVADAQSYVNNARGIYPQEAQSHKLQAALSLQQRNPQAALQALQSFDQLLPGDSGVQFLKGVSLETMGQKQQAAQAYNTYLKQVRAGDAAQHAYTRLKAWGYAK